MTLKEFLDLYDNWNGITVVNDGNLSTLIKGTTSEIAFEDGNLYDEDIMASEVIAFGFYDNELCVRVDY